MSESPLEREGIDRVAPTRRPPRHPVMHQTWAHLLFLHWAVPVAALRPLVPPELDIDTFDGRAFVGLVPFTMSGVRPAGLPALPGLSATHEVNVRTYVHHRGRDPGVWFFSLDANHRLAVLGARWLWSLPYFHARIRLDGVARRPGPAEPAPGTVLAFASDRRRPDPRPASCRLRWMPRGGPEPANAGTLEHFLVERYLLYAQNRRRLYRGQVHHAPYPLQPAEVLGLEETLLDAARIDRPDGPPLAHYARRVQVEIFALEAVAT